MSVSEVIVILTAASDIVCPIRSETGSFIDVLRQAASITNVSSIPMPENWKGICLLNWYLVAAAASSNTKYLIGCFNYRAYAFLLLFSYTWFSSSELSSLKPLHWPQRISALLIKSVAKSIYFTVCSNVLIARLRLESIACAINCLTQEPRNHANRFVIDEDVGRTTSSQWFLSLSRTQCQRRLIIEAH